MVRRRLIVMKVTDKDIIAMRDLASRLNLVGKDRLFDNR
jgi:hypothetical protein